MKDSEFKALLQKYLDEKCTPEEVEILESWYLFESQKPSSIYTEAELNEFKTEIWKNFSQAANRETKVAISGKTTIHSYFYLALAATLTLVLGFAFYFYQLKEDNIKNNVQRHNVQVVPGTNTATLMLADGRKIELDDSQNGELAQASGIQIVKLADGQICYKMPGKDIGNDNRLSSLINTVQTPIGGQYQVILEDGTRVWLNAASSIKYPMAFSKTERSVELEGEAYFEVAKDKKRKFLVKSGGQEIEVLGTHFNVNAYPDEYRIKTTLLEGSVRIVQKTNGVMDAVVLKPGQESDYSKGIFSIHEVDAEDAVAWKNGYFVFDNEDLKTAVRKISRWYNLDVEYVGQFSAVEIGGSVSRFDNIEQVLQVLRITTNLKFKVEGRRLIIRH